MHNLPWMYVKFCKFVMQFVSYVWQIFLVTESGLLVERKRRKYERDFLLQCRYMQVCMEKPANLPDIDVILDVPQPPQSRTGNSGGGWQRYSFLKRFVLKDIFICNIQWLYRAQATNHLATLNTKIVAVLDNFWM